MHQAAREFVARVAPLAPAAGDAVEFGAYDVNGSCREYFPGYRWHGVDIRAGRNVDTVIDARRFDGAGRYDLVLCTETLEHAPRPEELLVAARRALKPAGWLILTAAAPERPPHSCDGDHAIPAGEHYQGVDPADLETQLRRLFASVTVTHAPGPGDVYAVASAR